MGLLSDVHVHREDHASDIERLLERINAGPVPDLLVLAGDVSHRTEEIRRFLRAIDLPCPKCWVPGNHDIWVIDRETESDSPDHRYRVLFPQLSSESGWHYLPGGSLVLPRSGVVVVGTMGWFTGEGYSEWFDTDADARDARLAEELARDLRAQIEAAPAGSRLIVVTHHLPHRAIPSYRPDKGSAWSSYLEAVLQEHRSRVILAAHGHRHVRYGPTVADGVLFVAHPFGYPHQHEDVDDGYRLLELPYL